MKKFIKLMVLAMSCCLMFVGCTTEPGTSVKPTGTQSAGTEQPTAQPTEQPTQQPSIGPVEYSFGTAEMTMPFWYSSVMYNECVVFHKNMETGEISANLMFEPIQIVCLKNNSLTIDLVEGVHYKRDENDPSKLIWLQGDENFVIPYFEPNDLNGVNPHGDTCGTSSMNGKIGNCTYCVGPAMYEKQLAITYTYNIADNKAPHAEYSAELLPKTIAKLNNKEDLTIIIYGDSIFTGCDSSATYGREPKTPTFFKLLEKQLETFYDGVNVRVKNPSVGGWGAADGVANVHEKVSTKSPDLVILGFGMNDAQVDGTQEAKQMQAIMDDVLAENPNCEFIVVSTFHANPQVGWDIKQGTHAAGFKTLEKTGVACMDMYQLHSYILARKTFQSTTGNNINHPNDWFARMYASQLLSMLYDYNANK